MTYKISKFTFSNMGNTVHKTKNFSTFIKKYKELEYCEYEFDIPMMYCYKQGGVHVYTVTDETTFKKLKGDPSIMMFDNSETIQTPKFALAKLNLSTSYIKTIRIIVPRSKSIKYDAFLKKINVSYKDICIITASELIKSYHLFAT